MYNSCSLLHHYIYSCFSIEPWFLIHWEAENSVTIHKEDEIVIDGEKVPGEFCRVSFGRKLYTGVITATGEPCIFDPICKKPSIMAHAEIFSIIIMPV